MKVHMMNLDAAIAKLRARMADYQEVYDKLVKRSRGWPSPVIASQMSRYGGEIDGIRQSIQILEAEIQREADRIVEDEKKTSDNCYVLLEPEQKSAADQVAWWEEQSLNREKGKPVTLTEWPVEVPEGRWVYHTIVTRRDGSVIRGQMPGEFRPQPDGKLWFRSRSTDLPESDFVPGEKFVKVEAGE